MTDKLKEVRSKAPSSCSEAENRFRKWRSTDPFPEIESSLLNCADFCDYVTATGMIHPFEPSEENLKMATYAFSLEGKAVRWNQEGNIEEVTIKEGQDFYLEQNSISYVTLKPYLRIPDYIALRFNLKIDHVYKGLLLGTGPIIDPGYQGYLSIPLHNLTNNRYRLVGGQKMIWVEFTKLSRHNKWSNSDNSKKKKEIKMYTLSLKILMK